MNSLAQLATDFRGTMPEGGLMAERKWDGFRCLYFRGVDGRPRLWSRQGMPLEGASHVFKRLQAIEEAAGVPLFIDGEIVVDGTLAATKHWFETGWRRGGDKGLFHAFDCLPFAEWKRGGTDQPLYQRKAYLARLFADSEPVSDGWTWPAGSCGRATPIPVQLVADEWVFDAAHVLDEARRVWAIGGEGLMLKDAEAPYRRNRSSAWLKVKQENFAKWRMAA